MRTGPDEPTPPTSGPAPQQDSPIRADQDMKKPRRPPRIVRPRNPSDKSTGLILDFHPSRIKPEKLEAFKEAYIQTRGNAAKAARTIGMSPAHAKADAWRLVRAMNFRVVDALEMLGIDAMSQGRKLAALREARMPKWNPGEEQWDTFLDSGTQLGATIEINRLRDEYPARKEPAPQQGPVVVIFNTNIEMYKELTYAPGKIIEPGSVQDQP